MHLRKKQPFFDKDIVDDRVIRKPALKQIPSERESIFKMMIAAVPFLVVFFLATSFITTQTFTFGYPLPSTQKLYKQYLKEKPTKTFTVEELSKYDGTNPDLPVYISLLGIRGYHDRSSI